MFNLTDPELITLGIGGAVLMGTCVVEEAKVSARAICFALGIILLVIALVSMVTD